MRKTLILLPLLLAACASVPLLPYKVEVQQGNHVTQEMVTKLKSGMTKSQVRFILGTPLITDAFHADRWDYVYRLEKRGQLTEQRRLTVIFEDEKLKRVEGDVVPAPPSPGDAGPSQPMKLAGQGQAEARPAKGDENPKPGSAQPEASKTEAARNKPGEEKGFFGRMLEKIGL